MTLTPTEQSVLKLVAEGFSSKQVGALLNRSKRTVETHRNKIMRKVGAHSAVDMVRWAYKNLVVRP